MALMPPTVTHPHHPRAHHVSAPQKDEGFFVGSALSGSPVHVDQVQWSNIGKNYIGHKLLAIWKYGRESFPFLDRSLREM